jgi:hypothetical protein
MSKKSGVLLCACCFSNHTFQGCETIMKIEIVHHQLIIVSIVHISIIFSVKKDTLCHYTCKYVKSTRAI